MTVLPKIKLKTIIADDEPLARDLLAAILSEMPEIELINKVAHGQAVIDAVLEQDIDLLFLDIQMPEMNGFEVVKAIQNDIMPMIVFTTAHASYAVDAFNMMAIDYVLKPLHEMRVRQSVERALHVRATYERTGLEQDKMCWLATLDDVISKVNMDIDGKRESHLTGTESSFLIREKEETLIIASDNIDWFEAAGDYVCVHVGAKTHIMRATLKSVHARLPKQKFLRIHRSTLVNISRLRALIPAPKGEAYLDLLDNTRLKVSRTYVESVKTALAF